MRPAPYIFLNKFNERKHMTQELQLPTLYGVSKKGKVKQWSIKAVENEDNTATLIVSSGYVDGKIRESPKLIKKGKNIGKANETTPFEQAASEAQSQWTSKRDENYEPEQMDPANYIPRLMLPQLAKGPKKGKIVFPAYIQPKLNGICDLAEPPMVPPKFSPSPNLIQHHSRGGQLFDTLAHLDPWIKQLNPPAPVHGELYKHGWSLQKIGSYVKKIKPDQHLLEFWLYDLAVIGPKFSERIMWLQQEIEKLGPDSPIKFVPTYVVKSYEEAKMWHDKWVQEGFEGAMLKNVEGVYMFQYNSDDLEKVKEFQDSEFEIIGGKEGSGTDEGCVIYRCITKEGKEFDARPRGSVEDRQQMLINLPNDIGKMLTVRYPELSDDGVPLQPVGIPEAEAVRDYE
jgi:DNA ligase-1